MEKLYYLNAKIGSIVYLRINGQIHAAKYMGSSISCGICNMHAYIIAGKGNDKKWYSDVAYPTIEDAINGNNHVKVLSKPLNEIVEECGFGELEDCGKLKVYRYKWNNYHPTKVILNAFCLTFWYDADGFHVKVGICESKKTYATYEECIADNHVKVVTF